MKKILVIFLFVFVSCSDNENDLAETVYDSNSKIILFGNKSDVNTLIENSSFEDVVNIYRSSSPELEEAVCYDGTGYANSNSGGDNGSKPGLDDGSDGNGNMFGHFNTLVGDLFISNDQDPDAVQRVEFIGDVQCYPPYAEQNAYINVIIESAVNTNWRNAVNVAILELNDVINNNPLNDNFPISLTHPDTPHVYFRLANSENPDDYGNITIRSGEVNVQNAIASAQIGNYNEIGNTGVYKHNVGTRVTIDPDYNDYPLQLAITAMIHEIGHTLGFKHSNNSTANIAGTTQTSDSFMNSVLIGPWDTNGFSSEDLTSFDLIFDVETEFIIMDCN